MNEEYLKLPNRCRSLIVDLLGCKNEFYTETRNPSVDYDSMKHLFPLEKLYLHYNGIGEIHTGYTCVRII